MFQNLIMTDPILYLSMLLGLGGVFVLISSFHDDDDGDDDGEKYIYNLERSNFAWQLMWLLKLVVKKSCLQKISTIKIFS